METDIDGLNDSEELNLGSDGFATDPWKADTDGDTLADNEVAVKGTSPVLADTDRDGVRDDVDRVPLGDAFIKVQVVSARVYGGDEDGSPNLEPFVSVQVGNQTAYTSYPSVASGSTASFNHIFSVNVPDDQDYVTITVKAWDYDSNNVHDPFEVSRYFESGVWLGDVTWTFSHSLTASGTVWYNSSGINSMRLDPLTVTATTVIPPRITTYLALPNDYAGLYNVTNAAGQVVSRRYVGEPRLVPILLNLTRSTSFESVAILVPRSVFLRSFTDRVRIANSQPCWTVGFGIVCGGHDGRIPGCGRPRNLHDGVV